VKSLRFLNKKTSDLATSSIDIPIYLPYPFCMFKKGDDIIIKAPFWHLGENLGGRVGWIESTDGHIQVFLPQYHSNPVKVFSSDIKHVNVEVTTDIDPDDESEWDVPTKEYNLAEMFPDWNDDLDED